MRVCRTESDVFLTITVSHNKSPSSGKVLTCDCGLLAPRPLHSASPRPSVPRVSRHKPPCFNTLDTASCSGTLYGAKREETGAKPVKGLISTIKNRWIKLSNWIATLSNVHHFNMFWKRYTVTLWETRLIWSRYSWSGEGVAWEKKLVRYKLITHSEVPTQIV